MKKIKKIKSWGIFQNASKEVEEYGFNFTVLHPDNMEYRNLCTPADTDIELDTLEDAIDWVRNY